MALASGDTQIPDSKEIPIIIENTFRSQKNYRDGIPYESLQDRVASLKMMKEWILTHRDEITAAVYQDFRKPHPETDSQEIYSVLTEIDHAVRHLKSWMKPHRVPRTLPLLAVRAWVKYVPRGLVLIISPWNFPFLLSAGPLVSAIAAGNCVMLKPSEYSHHTSRLVREMVKDIFPENQVAVICGSKETASELLKYPFNHIFFTGSTEVGKIVMAAAAKNLSSVTLELGGKSPAVVDETANLEDAARKIVWGKFINAGQTCIAPDFVVAHHKIISSLLDLMKKNIIRFYGNETDQNQSPDFARIIDRRHFERLNTLIREAVEKNARVEIGGIPEQNQYFIPPTILTGVTPDCRIMQEEIFGPVLPVISYESTEEALRLLKTDSSPLAVYIFSRSRKSIAQFFRYTHSGSGGINEVVIQFIHPYLPFGGRGSSGFGNSHGFYGFKTFSHEKAFIRGSRWNLLKLVHPPYNSTKKRIINLLIRYF